MSDNSTLAGGERLGVEAGRELHPYMVYDREAGPEEGAILVFAHTARGARKLGAPEVQSWMDATWIDVAARRLRGEGDGAHLRKSDQPHVVDNPPPCDSCEQWRLAPLTDGLCDDCLAEREYDKADEAADQTANPTPEKVSAVSASSPPSEVGTE